MTGEVGQRSMVQMFKDVARVFTRSQTPDTRAKTSGEISVMPLRPLAFGNVHRTLALGEVRSGFSVKSVGTLSDVRKMCELERTAICSMKVFEPKV
jgi:hypothetical protein